jgi:esterase/lipase superfamily enzyme
VWQLDFSADPARHVILKDIEKIGSLSNFYSRIRGRLRESDRAEALVYIHGFNQSFEDGVDTAAVLGTDLEIDGAVLAYSWPSKKNAFYLPGRR